MNTKLSTDVYIPLPTSNSTLENLGKSLISKNINNIVDTITKFLRDVYLMFENVITLLS